MEKEFKIYKVVGSTGKVVFVVAENMKQALAYGALNDAKEVAEVSGEFVCADEFKKYILAEKNKSTLGIKPPAEGCIALEVSMMTSKTPLWNRFESKSEGNVQDELLRLCNLMDAAKEDLMMYVEFISDYGEDAWMEWMRTGVCPAEEYNVTDAKP